MLPRSLRKRPSLLRSICRPCCITSPPTAATCCPRCAAVKYTEGEGIDTLISELKKNPNNAALMKSPLAEDVELLSSSLTDTSSGRTLTLDFSKRADLGAEETVLSYAAIIYTLTGIYPRCGRTWSCTWQETRF